MGTRSRFGAVLGAAAVLLLTASGVFAGTGPPLPDITVTKVADPPNVPASGGTVTYTISVAATGTGFFQAVVVDDGMAGCTLTGPTGDTGKDGKLEGGETWVYTCTVTNVLPNTKNTANVNLCHDNGACGTGDVTKVASATVGEATVQPTTAASQPNTATLGAQASGAADSSWLLVLALGVLLASIVVLTPAKAVRRR